MNYKIPTRVEQLEVENIILKDRIISLERELGIEQLDVFGFMGLTVGQTKVMAVILKRGFITHSNINTMMRPFYKFEQTDPNTARVTACFIRKQLKAFGIKLISVYGEGYRMDDLDRAKLRALLEKNKGG